VAIGASDESLVFGFARYCGSAAFEAGLLKKLI
jgi:hypothetical protein